MDSLLLMMRVASFASFSGLTEELFLVPLGSYGNTLVIVAMSDSAYDNLELFYLVN